MTVVEAIDLALAEARMRWLHATWQINYDVLLAADKEITDLLEQRQLLAPGVPR